MNNLMRFTFKLLDLLVIFVITFSAPVGVLAAPRAQEDVATGTGDHHRSARLCAGSNGYADRYGLGTRRVVHIFVNDDAWQSWSHGSNPDPVADGNGAFTYAFQLPTWFVANYSVTATGSSGSVATITFTDLSIGTYDQCSNDHGDWLYLGRHRLPLDQWQPAEQQLDLL